jgi:hypothetical protein
MSRKRSVEIPETPQPIQMSDEERESLEREKAHLLASLNASRPTITVKIAPVEKSEPVPAAKIAPPPPPTPEPPAPYDGPSAAEVRAQLAALEQQLKKALRHEAQARQHQAVVDQRTAQQRAGEELAPTMGKLDYHLRELDRVQRTYGPTLKEYARSCASGTVDERRVLSDIYSSAAPLGQKLGEARRTLESAIAGIRRASESGRPHEVEQARVLADGALCINILTLETDCKALIAAKEQLRGGTVVSALPDHLDPQGLTAPADRLTVVDMGGSILR